VVSMEGVTRSSIRAVIRFRSWPLIGITASISQMRTMTLQTDPSYGEGSEVMAFALSCKLARHDHEVFLLYETDGSCDRTRELSLGKTSQ